MKSIQCRRVLFLFVIGCFLICGCEQEKKRTLGSITSLGQVDQRLDEASGLVASVINQGMLWAINDSGNPAEVFLIDQHAKTRMVCTLFQVRNRDWEDIAIGAGPDPHKTYVYVADIGDNWGRYDFKLIYRFEEPKLEEQKEITITQFDTLVLKMPDGARDMETILIDPYDNDLFLISKREDSVGLYTAHYPFRKGINALHRVMTLPFTEIVSGSITLEGTEVLLKDYYKVYYWKRSSSENLKETFTRKPIELPYEREHRGEAIAWSNEGDAFYTLSEGSMGSPGELLKYNMKRGK